MIVRDPALGLLRGSMMLLMAAIVLLAVPPARGQEEEFVPDDEFVPEEESAPDEDAANFQAIDDLLALDEEVLSDPGTYSYDPGARRDPFRSLLIRNTEDETEEKRPEGPPGLLIDEITVEGVFVLPEGPVAQIQSASQETSYLLRPGDELWDGDVLRITLDEVVFKQELNDPTALRPFREVVKRLNPQQ